MDEFVIAANPKVEKSEKDAAADSKTEEVAVECRIIIIFYLFFINYYKIA